MIMGRLQWAAIAVFLIALALVIAYWRGWVGGVNHERHKWEVKWAEASAKAVKQQHEWNAKANELTREVIDARDQIDSMANKIRDLLTTRVSRSRTLISADITRMLNTLSPIRETVTSPSGVVETRETVTSDSGGSSEYAVVNSLVECRVGYAKCANQANALIQWIREVTQ